MRDCDMSIKENAVFVYAEQVDNRITPVSRNCSEKRMIWQKNWAAR